MLIGCLVKLKLGRRIPKLTVDLHNGLTVYGNQIEVKMSVFKVWCHGLSALRGVQLTTLHLRDYNCQL